MRFLPGLVVICLFFLAACKDDGKRDIRDYYFPVEELRSGKVYEYDLAKGDSSSPEYWYYRAFQRDSGLFLAGTYYDSRFQIGQIVREKITDKGVAVSDYFIYENDWESGKQIQTTAIVDSSEVFPFRVRDSSGVYLFRLRYHPAIDTTATIYIRRTRLFLGDGPTFEYQGEPYPCIRFGVRELIGNRKEGIREVEGIGEEWYAKGLGLVYYRRSFGKGGQVKYEYRLKDIFPMAELEKRAESFFGD